MDTNPKRQFAVEVAEKLKAAGYEALWAGGCVRDFLLGRQPDDYDVATNALPDQVREVFGKRRTLTVGASFGVIIVIGTKEAGNVEVATFRTEGPYLDGRRPENVSFSTAKEDAQRRDFTINGMFYDPVAKKVLDYVGGERDLGERVVCAIGDPHDRMQEDKLRMLRAVRFTASLDFILEERTAEAVREMAAEINVVSIERIAQELRKMLVDQHRRRAMQLCHDVCLLEEILPELDLPHAEGSDEAREREWQTTLKMLEHLVEPDFELAAATLLHHVVRPGETVRSSASSSDRGPRTKEAAIVAKICKRLRLSNDETDQISWLVAHQYELIDGPNLPLSKLKRLLAHPFSENLLKLARVEALATHEDLSAVVFCEAYLRETPREEIDPLPVLTGDDLIAAGYQPGKQFKEWLDTVRDTQLEGTIATKEEALKLVGELSGG